MFDDAAAEQLWIACRRQVPEVTVEEVLNLFRHKLPESRARGIENPNGFLLRAVARSCTPAAIRALRQGREAPQDAPITFGSDELEGLLQDPNTPEEIRRFIEARLHEER